MARTYKIAIDLSNIASLSGAVQAAAFQNLSAAVERIAIVGAERWKTSVLKARLWSGEAQAYADSITYRMTGPYSATISANYKYVEDIETGRPPRDLKRMLDTSLKVRVAKRGPHAGQRYLIIPMRHQTPGADAGVHGRPMPTHIYSEARQLAPSSITGSGSRASGTGAFDVKTKRPMRVAQHSYKWGGRLPAGLAPKLKPEHKTDPYAGMVRFDTSAGKGRSSSYLTFRIMGEWQTGAWVVPAQPGLYIAKGVTEGLERDAKVVFGRAMQADIDAAGSAPE